MSDKELTIQNTEGGVINIFYDGAPPIAPSPAPAQKIEAKEDENTKTIRMASIDRYSSPLEANIHMTPWGEDKHKVSLFVKNVLLGQVIQQDHLVYNTKEKAKEVFDKIASIMDGYREKAEKGLMHSAIISQQIKNDMLKFEGDMTQPESKDLTHRYKAQESQEALETGIPPGLLTYDPDHFPYHEGIVKEAFRGLFSGLGPRNSAAMVKRANKDISNETLDEFLFKSASLIDNCLTSGDSNKDVIGFYCEYMRPDTNDTEGISVLKKAGLVNLRPLFSNLKKKSDSWLKLWVKSNPERIRKAIDAAYGVAFEKSANMLPKVNRIDISDYDLFLFDADMTLWDSDIPAYKMEEPYNLSDSNTIIDGNGQELTLKSGIRDLLSMLRSKSKNIGLVSKSEDKSVPVESQPVIKILKILNILDYFNDITIYSKSENNETASIETD